MSGLNSYSQVELENTYNMNGNQVGKGSYFFNTENASYYYTYSTGLNPSVNVYTSNHSLYKTVNLPVAQYKSFESVMLFTDHLFNSDALIEFIYVQYGYPSDAPGGSYIPYYMSVINENGEILYDLGNRQKAKVVKTSDDSYKLIAEAYIPYTTTVNVYGLSGTLSTNQQYLVNNEVFLYPNPSNSNVNILNPLKDGEFADVKVFSMDGKKVLTKSISGSSSPINLDVSSLTSGTYIFRINDLSWKFLKN